MQAPMALLKPETTSTMQSSKRVIRFLAGLGTIRGGDASCHLPNNPCHAVDAEPLAPQKYHPNGLILSTYTTLVSGRSCLGLLLAHDQSPSKHPAFRGVRTVKTRRDSSRLARHVVTPMIEKPHRLNPPKVTEKTTAHHPKKAYMP